MAHGTLEKLTPVGLGVASLILVACYQPILSGLSKQTSSYSPECAVFVVFENFKLLAAPCVVKLPETIGRTIEARRAARKS